MKKNYILTLITLLFAGVLHGQITQATDINATGNSSIMNPAVYNGVLYFEADDGLTVGDELYTLAADGTVSLFKDINQDPDDTSPNSDPSEFKEFNGQLYFSANSGDKTGSGKELWVTDGTEAGTVQVTDINTEAGKGSNPQYLFVFNNKLYFQANDGSSTQWWSHDGLSTTVKVTNLRSDGYATTSYPVIDAANSRVFFQAIADNGKIQLFVMGADESVTEIIINAGNHGYAGNEAILYNGSLIFQGDNGTDGDELWISDGTVAGTQMLLDINTTAAGDNSDPESFAIYNGKVYFVADPGTGTQLWETDGTTAGTKLVVAPNAGAEGSVEELKVYNGKLYFTADDGVNGAELWVYDGTDAMLLADINATAGAGSDPAGYTEVDGLLFFEADDGTGVQLWLTDGTASGTKLVSSLFEYSEKPLDVNSSEFVYADPWFLFTGDDAFGDDIFVIDVTSMHKLIQQSTDINATGNSSIMNPAVYNGVLYFEADDGLTVGDELYTLAADGTVSLFKDINQDPDDTSPNSDPSEFKEFNGQLYFSANSGDKTGSGKELWVTDGTEAGTVQVTDINTEAGKGSNPQYLFVFNNKLYFQANDGSSTQWWSHDGLSTTVKVTNLRSDGYATTSYPIIDEANSRVFFQAIADNGKMQLFVMGADESVTEIIINAGNHGYAGNEAILYNGSLIFQGDNGTDGDELWISDGTVAGTQMLLDINTTAAGDNSDPESFAIYNGKVYFVADPGTGTQLWETDGTTAGTKLVVAPNAGAEGSVEELKVYNGNLYFTADDGVNGAELWVYDGTDAMLLADINATAGAGSDPAGYTEVDGLLFFEADDGTGTKLWVSDGTTENTMRVAEALNSAIDPLDVNSSEFVVMGTLLYYTADDAFGDEFFMIDASEITFNNIMFTVTDGLAPVENAVVTFKGETATTNTAGEAYFYGVGPGAAVDYMVGADGYADFHGKVDVMETDVTESVVLTQAYNVTFNVTDGTNPLQGAEVTFNGNTGLTDAAGVVVFEKTLPAEARAYSVALATYEAAAGTVTVVDDHVTEPVTMVLTSYSVTFNVTDGADAVEGAAVAFNGTSETTDASGVAVFDGVFPAVGMEYTVTKSDYMDATGSVDVVDADVAEDVVLSIIPTYSVTFNVTDGTNALQGAEVAFNGETVATDAAGNVTFEGLYAEVGIAYTVTLAGYDDASGTVDIVDADVAEPVTMTLTTYTVTFNVTDGSGAVEGAAVAFNGTSETTDASGVTIFEGVVPATGLAYTVTKSDYLDATGTIDVDGDEVENVSLQATSVAGSMIRELNVYPNPSNGSVHIDGLTPGSRYEVHSMNQTVIRTGVMSSSALRLDLHPGVYILRVDAAEGVMMKKIVIR